MSFLNRDMSLTGEDPSNLFSPCSHSIEHSAADNATTVNDANSHGKQFNPVMKGPRIMDARKANVLQHQRSAKELIGRYESMSSSERPRSIRPPSQPHNLPRTIPVNKDRSPIRQSFRNLFSVFRKGNAVTKDRTNGLVGLSAIIGSGKSTPLPGLSSQPTSDVPTVLPQVEFEKNISRASSRTYSGSLLYLSTSPSTLPVWTTCTATLQSDRILITWQTTHGNPSYHTISLARCEDVRSLAMNQICPEERALLPRKGDSEGLRVFEILFEDKPREKFAATSAHERAGWVCAIWDAILPSHERKEISCDILVPTEDAVLTISTTFATHCPTERAIEVAGIQHDLPPSLNHLERSLPPTPIDDISPTFPAHVKGEYLHDLPHRLDSPITLSPIPPVARTSSSNSPSIANLGQLSVVKQRLAQIERINSSSSSIGPPSPCSSRGSKNISPRVKVVPSEIWRSEPLGLQHRSSLRSNGGDSIVDSYGDMMSPYVDHSRSLPTTKSCRRNLKKPTYPVAHQDCDSPKGFPNSEGLFSPQSQYSVTDEPSYGPLVGILQSDAMKAYGQSPNFGDQILSLQQDVQKLPEQLKTLVVDSKQAPLLEAIDQTVRGIDQQTKERGNELRELRENLHEILKTIVEGQVPSDGRGGSEVVTANDSGLLQMLDEMRLKLESNLPKVLRKLGEIQTAQTSAGRIVGNESPAVMNNMKPASGECVLSGDAMAVDMSQVNTKLDGLVALHERCLDSNNPTITKQVPEELTEILTLLKGNENHRTIQEQQQAESVRYLNELNSWLEMFVNNGTSQIQAVATGVQQLCNALGCTPKSMDALGTQFVGGSGNLLADIRQLLLANKERHENTTTLQDSVNNLIAAINYQNANIFTPESVIDLINRQRQDQEELLRALATELSGEIRGERLKFVEAMKSATSINVQLHVDQFKKELTREVLAMTQEVERLQRERHGVENQIADLLAFYSKQKQTGVPWTLPSPSAPPQPQADSFNLSSRRHPLPNPNSHFSKCK